MTARIVAGRIGGLPVAGGYIPLEKAEMAQVVDAASGLLRETVSTGVKLAVAGAGFASLFAIAAAIEAEERKEAEDRRKNPPQTFAGIVRIRGMNGDFMGICAQREIYFTIRASGAYQNMCASIDHIVSIDSDVYNWGRNRKDDFYAIIKLVDGSEFRQVDHVEPLMIETVAGCMVIDPSHHSFKSAVGMSVEKVTALKERLIAGLKQTRVELLDQIGLELLQKYFHLEGLEIIDVPALPPPKPVIEAQGEAAEVAAVPQTSPKGTLATESGISGPLMAGLLMTTVFISFVIAVLVYYMLHP